MAILAKLTNKNIFKLLLLSIVLLLFGWLCANIQIRFYPDMDETISLVALLLGLFAYISLASSIFIIPLVFILYPVSILIHISKPFIYNALGKFIIIGLLYFLLGYLFLEIQDKFYPDFIEEFPIISPVIITSTMSLTILGTIIVITGIIMMTLLTLFKFCKKLTHHFL